jgi:DNA-binding transcriptional MerR regulator
MTTERTIGELAHAAGVNVETVRYYERRGLLTAPPRPARGYRKYGDDSLWRLQFIGRAKELGFTLSEIRDLLDEPSSRDVLDAARRKVADVNRRLADLAALQTRLRQLVDTCENGDGFDCVALAVPVTVRLTH